MKFFRTIAVGLATAAALLSGNVFAQTTSTFNVNLTLTPKCYINMAGSTPADVATSDITMTYTAFQTADVERSTGFTVTCTSTLGYGIAVTNDTDTIAGIDYYLKLVSGTTASYTSAAGEASLATLAGSGAAQSYTIGVRAPGGQPGTCASGTCPGSKQHTITVSY
jgi:hypothetical protein